MEVKIQIASVKVMRSHDYCHFEVSLSTTEATTTEQVDALRKEAARLTDKAVEQYRVMKVNSNKLANDKLNHDYFVARVEAATQKPESERNAREQADIKAHADQRWKASRRYNYEDDWEEDRDEYNAEDEI